MILSGGAGFCNAVRRTLLSDVQSWAACSVTVRVNTTCFTDEYLAHRIGLIPVRRVGAGDTMTLCVSDRTARASDLVGPAFEPVHPGVEIATMVDGHALDLTVTYDRRAASTHARYAPCAAVGMEQVDGDGRHRLVFEPLDPKRTRASLLDEALDALDARVAHALAELAHQDRPPPRSMC